jgi:hypothetical protein
MMMIDDLIRGHGVGRVAPRTYIRIPRRMYGVGCSGAMWMKIPGSSSKVRRARCKYFDRTVHYGYRRESEYRRTYTVHGGIFRQVDGLHKIRLGRHADGWVAAELQRTATQIHDLIHRYERRH